MDYFSIKSCSLRGGLIWIGMGNIEVFKKSKYFIDLENLFLFPINIKKDGHRDFQKTKQISQEIKENISWKNFNTEI